ncbi:hypothetical protein [Actinomycetospora sp. CA-053990]|uniref:hypothetical protein n=1 Tax=Actinomycetospora sp. CA-053990 TaxID=3239891 RepID=UPI003D8D1F13
MKVGAAAAGVGTAARERGVAVVAERGASRTAPVAPLSCSVAGRSGGAAWATCSLTGSTTCTWTRQRMPPTSCVIGFIPVRTSRSNGRPSVGMILTVCPSSARTV